MKFRYVKMLWLCLSMFLYSITKAAPVIQHSIGYASQNNDRLTPKQVIVKFLQWYKINMQKVNSFPVLIKDSADNFMINKTACTNYLNFLKSSKCLSNRYISYWRSFFNDQAISMQANPVQKDIPEGFDLDFVLITQEPELVLDNISQAKFKTVSLTAATAVIAVNWPQKDGMQYQIEMHKNTQGWQIEYIGTPNFD